MKCFGLSYPERKVEAPKTPTKSISVQSFSSIFTDRDVRRSGSGLNSQDVSDLSTESIRSTTFPSFSHRSSNLRVFTFSELKAATKNFSLSAKIGEGGFGCVYTGVIKNPRDPTKRLNVAVKQLGRTGLQGHKEWVTEVNVLGVVEHPNLVKLVGYCAEDDERGIQRLLVYEYMPNRSVEDHLSTRSEAPLSWTMRLKVAQDAARGLAYLHEEMDFQIIFRDFKSSNILLDDQWNAKLSDFGLARLGPEEGLTHVSTAVVGTMGYAAPEYIQTGHLTAKSDVWGYGVFLYELITGRRPLDKNRPKNEQKLLEWVKPYLDSKKFRLIIDSRLEGKYSLKSAQKLSMIANRCLSRNPKSRPKMTEVLEMVNQLVGGGTPHTTSPGTPLKSLAPMVAIEPNKVFVGSNQGAKSPENTKRKGERGSADIQHTEYACLSRVCHPKCSTIC
ncbi:serine/threonine-protein kinase PCRK1-like [Cynara cardunculus var. scolymus]|uniref:serine/threonine-protein kinase PCRK1-like n=1 Tax=Cynara cardunculus var. scolymus TaxID=59895 RepID=UPI000D62C68D|nr:serine/threonine-protein kinase PCRK1-like [Cynara cardunculus var. scolymus]